MTKEIKVRVYTRFDETGAWAAEVVDVAVPATATPEQVRAIASDYAEKWAHDHLTVKTEVLEYPDGYTLGEDEPSSITLNLNGVEVTAHRAPPELEELLSAILTNGAAKEAERRKEVAPEETEETRKLPERMVAYVKMMCSHGESKDIEYRTSLLERDWESMDGTLRAAYMRNIVELVEVGLDTDHVRVYSLTLGNQTISLKEHF